MNEAFVAVITGASAGVGRACAIAFARQGYRVGLLARGMEGLEGAKAEVEAQGGEALILQADVADADAVATAAERAERELGPIDVWVNGAMVTAFSNFVDMSPEEYRRITEVTYLGQVHGTMAALRHMRPRDYGTIVQIGSALSYRSIPLQSAYCGAKFAIRGFTDALRSELLHEGSRVRLSMVQLPAVNTPQFEWARNRMPNKPQPMPPIYQPEMAAQAVLRAADEAPRELWVGNSSLKAILGSPLAPAWVDKKMAQQGYSSQQSQEPEEPQRPDNLFSPLNGKHAVHGRFDERARAKAPQYREGATRKTLLSSVVATSLAGLLIGYTIGRRNHER